MRKHPEAVFPYSSSFSRTYILNIYLQKRNQTHFHFSLMPKTISLDKQPTSISAKIPTTFPKIHIFIFTLITKPVSEILGLQNQIALFLANGVPIHSISKTTM